MNFAGKWTGIAVGLVCLPLVAFGQPGFGPGGPGGSPQGRGGPGGPPPGYRYSGGPGPSMGNPHFVGGPSGGQSAPSGAPSRSYMPPPSMPSYPSYGRGQSPSSGIPSTRFGSVPNRSESAPMSSMRGQTPGGPGPGQMPSGGPMPPPDINRMQQALRQRDYDTIGKETEGVRHRTERIQRMEPDMSMQDRLKLPLINHMYRQGADLMDEGRSSRDDAKIRMGIQQINQANQKLDHLKQDAPPPQRPADTRRH